MRVEVAASEKDLNGQDRLHAPQLEEPPTASGFCDATHEIPEPGVAQHLAVLAQLTVACAASTHQPHGL